MTDEPDNLILSLLRQIRAAQDDHGRKLDALDERLSNLEIREGHSFGVLGQINARLLGLDKGQRDVADRLNHIESRLDEKQKA
jgi:uncharacterized coiled-coil protein SlyX